MGDDGDDLHPAGPGVILTSAEQILIFIIFNNNISKLNISTEYFHLVLQPDPLVDLPECWYQSDTVADQSYQSNVQTDVRIQNLTLS